MTIPKFPLFEDVARRIARCYPEGATVRLQVSDDHDDGTCDVTVLVEDEEIGEFVSTQDEVKVLALQTGGFAVPKAFKERAAIAKAKRLATLKS